MTSNMMKVLHTPLLRPTCTLSSTAGINICTNSWAGVSVNNNGEGIIGIQSRVYRPDMRKLVANHGSPKFTAKFTAEVEENNAPEVFCQ